MNKFLPLARLLRLPLVFSVAADILLGAFLCFDGNFNNLPWPTLALLLLSSACLYLSGMVFNDLFDIRQDRKERSNRPLASGEFSWITALTLAVSLIISGLTSAYFVSHDAFHIAVALAICILVYDGLKWLPFAPLMMGCCRGLNIILGGTFLLDQNSDPAKLTLLALVAAALTLHITAITILARHEAQGITNTQIRWWTALNLITLTTITAATFYSHTIFKTQTLSPFHIAIWIIGIIFASTQFIVYAMKFSAKLIKIANYSSEESGKFTQRTIGQMLGKYSMQCGCILWLINPIAWPIAIIIMLLSWPVQWLKRYIPIT